MADVVVMLGVERRDLAGEPIPSVEVLQAAINNGVTDVVVIGMARDGTMYIAGSLNDVDKVVGKLFAAATYLASHEYDQGIPAPSEPA